MAKLYFYYAAMNAGKTAHLLQANFNYIERGMKTMMYIPEIAGKKIRSRAGLEADAYDFCTGMNFLNNLCDYYNQFSCILIDEAQFLTKEQVSQLGKIVDCWNIPVLCYGLRTDFKGELFEGSAALLAIADNIKEIKTICTCGKKAIMNMRLDGDKQGEQIDIGGNDKYISKCRKCFYI